LKVERVDELAYWNVLRAGVSVCIVLCDAEKVLIDCPTYVDIVAVLTYPTVPRFAV
jgi:hypothetical protein